MEVKSARSTSQAEYDGIWAIGLEDLRLEIERHQVKALHRTVRVLRDVVPAARHDLLFARRNSRIVAVHGRRRRAGLGRFPAAQVADVRVLCEQERQCRGSCARQAHSEQRRLEGHVVDLGVAAIPVLDLQPLREVKRDALVDESVAACV